MHMNIDIPQVAEVSVRRACIAFGNCYKPVAASHRRIDGTRLGRQTKNATTLAIVAHKRRMYSMTRLGPWDHLVTAYRAFHVT